MTKVQHAIILLAGQGSRLKPLTDSTHKAMITIGGKTILERQVNQLLNNCITNFHFVLGYRASELKAFIQARYAGISHSLYFNENYAHTNTAYSLNLVLNHLNEKFILLDGDVIMPDQLLSILSQPTTENRLLCETHEDRLDAEAMKVLANTNHEIIAIGKLITKADPHQVFGESIGVGLFQRDWGVALKNYLDRALKHEQNWVWYYEDALQRLTAHGTAPSPLKMISIGEAQWVEVDDLTDLNRARELFG